MTYEPMIHLYQTKLEEATDEAVQEMVLRVVAKTGVMVDRVELLKALRYDRGQYEKGYADGRDDAQKWISVKERLPEKSGYYLCWMPKYESMERLSYSAKHMAFNAFDTTYIPESALTVTHWMPLPEPPKEEDK